jgi:hypothetical protein
MALAVENLMADPDQEVCSGVQTSKGMAAKQYVANT